MNGCLTPIDVSTMKELISSHLSDTLTEEMVEIMLRSGKNSRPLCAGTYHGKLLCLLGLIPPTLLSTSAYLWMYSTPTVKEHRVMFGRHARRFMSEMMSSYTSIVGHTTEASQPWLRSLGAEFFPPQGPFIPFEISQ